MTLLASMPKSLAPKARVLAAWVLSAWVMAVLTGPAGASADTASGKSHLFDPAELSADVETYYAFGHHRAGGAGEAATADWLSGRLADLGFDVTLHAFTLPQYELEHSAVQLGGETLDAFPYWLPPPIPDNRVSAPLTWVETGTENEDIPTEDIPAGRILIVQQSIQEVIHGMSDVVARASAYGAAGLVAISPSPLNEPWAVNAAPPYVVEPLPFPVVLVARQHSARLKAAAESGASATIVIRGKPLAAAESSSVLGILPGGKQWIVVSTPFSGWYGAAAERGSGVALWLALAGRLANLTHSGKGAYSIAMVATGAHEFDYLGARNLLASGALPAPAQTVLWIHLGAMIGAVEWRRSENGLERITSPIQVRIQTAESMLEWVKPAFSHIPAARFDTGRPLGELRDVRNAGYPALGLVEGGANPYFHTSLDRPDSVEGSNLAGIAAALARIIETLDGVPGQP